MLVFLFRVRSYTGEDLFRRVKKFPTGFIFSPMEYFLHTKFFSLRLYLSFKSPFDYAQGDQPQMAEKVDRLKSPRLI